MFGFRRLVYTILSRHFWVGVGVGFFLALLLTAQSAFALDSMNTDRDFTLDINTAIQYTSGSGIPVSQVGFGLPTDVLVRVPSTTISDNLTRQGIGFLASDGSCNTGTDVTAKFYDYGMGTSSTLRATLSTTALANCVWKMTTTTPLCTSGCDIRLQSSGGPAVPWSQVTSGTQIVPPVGTLSVSQSPWWIVGSVGEYYDALSGGGGATTTVFYPLGLNAMIDDMNCLSSATGTDCAFTYATTTQFSTDIWFFYMLCWFIGFSVVLYIVQKLT